tara:strand:- start:4762 stop:4911 length:150 start_codon:yes stop_codon:yes gene_type:complete
LIIDIRPAKSVCNAMNEINANQRLRVAQSAYSNSQNDYSGTIFQEIDTS